MTKSRIYLDNSATTRISDAALKKYNEISNTHFGNPSSLHEEGFLAEKELTAARETLLSSIGAKATSDVVFTASGSEANNLAIIGRALSKERYRKFGKIITSEGEHASVNEPLLTLERLGFKVVKIPTKNGILDKDRLFTELDDKVILVTLMMVNNETGALYDIATAAKAMRVKSPEAVLHVDATQSYMKIPFSKASLGADMITVSSHKIHGPKGVGALVVDKKIIKSRGLSPIIFGGGQEGGLRSGTENVPAIAAFATAISESYANLAERCRHIENLRSTLIEKLKEGVLAEISPTLPENHAPHILNITLPGIKSETMLHFLSSHGIFVSSGSACSSHGAHSPSSALVAYGRSAPEADSSIRISFSYENTEEDVTALAETLALGLKTLARIR